MNEDKTPVGFADLEQRLRSDLAEIARSIDPGDEVNRRRRADRTRRNSLLLVAAVLVLVVGAAALFSVLTDDDEGSYRVITEPPATTQALPTSTTSQPTTQAPVAPVDVSEAVDLFSLEATEGIVSMSADTDSVWISTFPSGLVRMSPDTPAIDATIEVPETLQRLSSTTDAVWATGGLALYRIEPETTTVVAVRDYATGVQLGSAIGDGDVWVSGRDPGLGAVVDRIDSETGSIVATISIDGEALRDVGEAPSSAPGDDAVWFSGGEGEQRFVFRIDPTTNTVIATIDISGGRVDILVGDGAVWVGTRFVIYRIDPVTNRIVDFIYGPAGFPGFCCDLALTGDALFASDTDGVLYRINTATNTLDGAYQLGADSPPPESLTLTDDALWFGGTSASAVGRVPLEDLLPVSAGD